jgi:hypothetical protein
MIPVWRISMKIRYSFTLFWMYVQEERMIIGIKKVVRRIRKRLIPSTPI